MSDTPLVCFTIDYEPDCPPYMSSTFRGVEEATAPLLAMLADLGVPATWFSTGDVAERYPDAVRAIVGAAEQPCWRRSSFRRVVACGGTRRKAGRWAGRRVGLLLVVNAC